jgi:hypothetical protein
MNSNSSNMLRRCFAAKASKKVIFTTDEDYIEKNPWKPESEIDNELDAVPLSERPFDARTTFRVGAVAEKIGMMQVWDDQGRRIPLTVLRVRARTLYAFVSSCWYLFLKRRVVFCQSTHTHTLHTHSRRALPQTKHTHTHAHHAHIMPHEYRCTQTKW